MKGSQIEFPLGVAVCAWCKPVKRDSPIGSLSHGICPRHFRKLMAELKSGRRMPSRRKRTHRIAPPPVAAPYLPLELPAAAVTGSHADVPGSIGLQA